MNDKFKNRLRKTRLSDSEKSLVEYIENNIENLNGVSIEDIAREAYVSTALIVRAAKKLGYTGWKEMKYKLLQEHQTIAYNDIVDIDIPFKKCDSYGQIMSRLYRMEKTIIEETYLKLDEEELEKAIFCINNAKNINLYAQRRDLIMAQYFQKNMVSFNKNININIIDENQFSSSIVANGQNCIIIFDVYRNDEYSEKVLDYLKNNEVKTIIITHNRKSKLAKQSHIILDTIESKSKALLIEDYCRNISNKYILDVLFGCLYSSENNKKNRNPKLEKTV